MGHEITGYREHIGSGQTINSVIDSVIDQQHVEEGERYSVSEYPKIISGTYTHHELHNLMERHNRLLAAYVYTENDIILKTVHATTPVDHECHYLDDEYMDEYMNEHQDMIPDGYAFYDIQPNMGIKDVNRSGITGKTTMTAVKNTEPKTVRYVYTRYLNNGWGYAMSESFPTMKQAVDYAKEHHIDTDIVKITGTGENQGLTTMVKTFTGKQYLNIRFYKPKKNLKPSTVEFTIDYHV